MSDKHATHIKFKFSWLDLVHCCNCTVGSLNQ